MTFKTENYALLIFLPFHACFYVLLSFSPALSYYETALELATQSNDSSGIADVHVNRNKVYISLKDTARAIGMRLRSMVTGLQARLWPGLKIAIRCVIPFL